MADRFYSVEFGGDLVSVAETGSTTAAADVEIRITYDATNNNKSAAIAAIDLIRMRILADTWPPA